MGCEGIKTYPSIVSQEKLAEFQTTLQSNLIQLHQCFANADAGTKEMKLLTELSTAKGLLRRSAFFGKVEGALTDKQATLLTAIDKNIKFDDDGQLIPQKVMTQMETFTYAAGQVACAIVGG